MTDSSKQPIPKESEIQKAILDYLAFKRILAWRTNSGTAQVRMGQKEYWMNLAPKGTSDIIGILNDGRFLAIEVKRPGGQATDEQLKFLKVVNTKGGVGILAFSLDDVMKVL